MNKLNIPNTTLIALVTSCFLQIGAQLFALAVVVSTLVAAPPRSFGMLAGEYRYDSSAFWNTVPMVTFLLFLVALVFNWRTQRRKLILVALGLFILAGLLAGIFLEPMFAELIKGGYKAQVDPVLQSQALGWYRIDWMMWGLSLVSGVVLLVALLSSAKVLDRRH